MICKLLQNNHGSKYCVLPVEPYCFLRRNKMINGKTLHLGKAKQKRFKAVSVNAIVMST